MKNSTLKKYLLVTAAIVSSVAVGSYAIGAQGFTERHEEEHLRREAEAYSNGLKDGTLRDGLGEIDRIYLSQIRDTQERQEKANVMRQKNNAEMLARLEKSREIISNTPPLVKNSDGEWMAPNTLHGHGPFSN